MSLSFELLAQAPKVISGRSGWSDPDAYDDETAILLPLEIDGVTIAGLAIRGRTRASQPDSDVTFQLEYQISQGQKYRAHLGRVDWRPLLPHGNPMKKGPERLRGLRFHCTHRHGFKDNWLPDQGAMRSGNLPFAEPVETPLPTFEALLDFVGQEFRIDNMNVIPVPGWSRGLL